MTTRTQRPARRVSVGLTFAISNAIKLVGIYVFLSELRRNPRSEIVMGYGVFMMTGAQLSEDFVIRMIGRFFAVPAPEEQEAA